MSLENKVAIVAGGGRDIGRAVSVALAAKGAKVVVNYYNNEEEGEATAAYIAQRMEAHPIRVTRIASGVPIGGDLKYVDQVTMKKAMEARHDVGRP